VPAQARHLPIDAEQAASVSRSRPPTSSARTGPQPPQWPSTRFGRTAGCYRRRAVVRIAAGAEELIKLLERDDEAHDSRPGYDHRASHL
jgi:hypothetical protein